MSKDLESIYKEVIGGPAPAAATESDSPSDEGDSSEAPASKSVGDKAYKQPKYDGTSGERDPREDFIEDEGDDKPWQEGDPEPEDEGDSKKSKKSSKPEGKEDDFEPIPDHLVEAGRLNGLSDDEIVKLAEDNPRYLEVLARNVADLRSISKSGVPPKEEDKKAEADKKETLPDANFEFDEDLADESTVKMAKYIKSVVPSLTKKIEALEGQLKAQEQDLGGVKEVARAEAIRRVDGYFDQRVADLPVLGETKTLTQSQKEARIAVHATAMMLQKGSDGKIGDEQALSMSIDMFRGRITDSKSKAKLISDLSARKQKFTARPSHGKKPLLERQSGKQSEEDRVLEVVEEHLQKIR